MTSKSMARERGPSEDAGPHDQDGRMSAEDFRERLWRRFEGALDAFRDTDREVLPREAWQFILYFAGQAKGPFVLLLLVGGLAGAIDATLVDEPPALARDGGMIRDGVDPELDELRHISRSGKQVIAEMEDRERSRTGIASLKIRFNRVFGYYIEVSKANLHNVPPDYHRKQTIAGGERFITPALKEYEEKVLGADERILEREVELFERLLPR